jgi:hypothetical protein
VGALHEGTLFLRSDSRGASGISDVRFPVAKVISILKSSGLQNCHRLSIIIPRWHGHIRYYDYERMKKPSTDTSKKSFWKVTFAGFLHSYTYGNPRSNHVLR